MADWVVRFIEHQGYFAIVLLMIAENVFPPLPSELIVPFAGYVAARGELHPVWVVLAASAGSLIGALPWYAVGRWVGCERLKSFAARYGDWLTLSPEQIDRGRHWLGRRGSWAIVVGRLVPALRSVVSLPAGIVEIPFPKFVLYTFVGSSLWNILLTAAGYVFQDQYRKFGGWMNVASSLVLAVLVAAYVLRLVRHRGRRRAARRS